jgi:DNA (cytosine-5)-methyltransferase 1
VNRPRLLDLCGCEGGAGEGYRRAGFDVYTIDLDANRLKHNPFPSLVMDALDALRQLIHGGRLWFTARDGSRELLGLVDFVAIHVSPPCQGYTRGNAGKVTAWPRLIRDFRVLLQLAELQGISWVIENVEDAGPELDEPVLLCGRMFDLRARDEDGAMLILERHRLFETNFHLTAPEHVEHFEPFGHFTAGVYGGGRRAKTRLRITSPDGLMVGTVDKLPAKWRKKGIPAGWTVEKIIPTPAEDRFAARIERSGGYVPRSVRVQGNLLGIDWMTARGLQESIPPAYSQHVGSQLLAHLGLEVAA